MSSHSIASRKGTDSFYIMNKDEEKQKWESGDEGVRSFRKQERLSVLNTRILAWRDPVTAIAPWEFKCFQVKYCESCKENRLFYKLLVFLMVKGRFKDFFVTLYFEIILGLQKSYKNSKSSLCPSVSFLQLLHLTQP